ncbi:MAG: 30S ribosomal protein S17 [Candidatus Omnitrophica bacterium]|nr:30S ribosomal protein S17 [Candidatus Omnitrophota bacterium]
MSQARRRLAGSVVSDKMQKTIVVRVERLVRHPLYERVIRKAQKFKAHDEGQTARVGDWVEMEETRPISKDKRWRLVKVLRRAPATIQGDVEENAKPRASTKRKAQVSEPQAQVAS